MHALVSHYHPDPDVVEKCPPPNFRGPPGPIMRFRGLLIQLGLWVSHNLHNYYIHLHSDQSVIMGPLASNKRG